MESSSANCSKVTRSIVGLKKEESDALLAFLLAHIGRGIDYQARVRWAPKTVVVWDVSHDSMLEELDDLN